METLRVGTPLDKAIDMGAIVSSTQLEQIQQLVEQGVREGAHLWQPSRACPTEGSFFPPSLFTNVSPAHAIAQVEIFGPVLVEMSFRTPEEAVALANNTPYGLAASVWSENINLALDVATKIQAGTVWVNCTNMFDASSGFGGYRESGYGREGGKEGLYEYVQPSWIQAMGEMGETGVSFLEENDEKEFHSLDLPTIDRTPKLFIGGKQVRPDSGYSRDVYGEGGRVIGQVGEGNRKDIRNAVEAAHAARGWASTAAHARAQILYYIAENVAVREQEFASMIARQTGCSREEGAREVQATIARLFSYGAWADKYEGVIHRPPMRGMTLAVKEPVGVIGIVCPERYPLLGFVSLVAPVIAMGNTVVVVPSGTSPLSATDCYQVFETSDVPNGVVNIVTGERDVLGKVLAEHEDVDACWYFGSNEGSRMIEEASASNMKRTWVNYGRERDWLSRVQGEGETFLREATQVKNIWIPYGE
jgi:aldehyde dehydrogenase (NAD+)